MRSPALRGSRCSRIRAQGELAGLLVIRAWHHDRGQKQRDVVLIPSSAHGTNPAERGAGRHAGGGHGVRLAGQRGCRGSAQEGRAVQDRLAALMVTYPSTHGVYEDAIKEICAIVHEFGGQVYMDGANKRAGGADESGVDWRGCVSSQPAQDVLIPHGGGGPGMGPIGVAEHLVPYLPGHSVVPGGSRAIHAVSAAPWGSASILLIAACTAHAWTGWHDGRHEVAILNANYIKARLEAHFPILYTRANGRVAHEMIVDLRPLKQASGIDESDVAKRLMDYGFHAPTISFPVPGTLMIEPTESEAQDELDRFCDALIDPRGDPGRDRRQGRQAGQRPQERAAHRRGVVGGQWTHAHHRRRSSRCRS